MVRLLDRRSNRLEPVISVGIPTHALNVELYAEMESQVVSLQAERAAAPQDDDEVARTADGYA